MRNEVAVRTGFEPVIGYSPIHAFQACSFSHSDTSPLECGANFTRTLSGCKSFLRFFSLPDVYLPLTALFLLYAEPGKTQRRL